MPRQSMARAATVLALSGARRHRNRLRHRPRRKPAAAVPSASHIRDLDIEFYQARVKRTRGARRDFTQVAGLYLPAGARTADNEDLVARSGAHRHSLELRREGTTRLSACWHRA